MAKFLLVLLVFFLAWFMGVVPVSAQNLDLGKSVYKTKVNCSQCHGWAGNGHKEDPRAPTGADLRETVMDAEALYTAVQCGIPGTPMPAFDNFAYKDDRCYGMTAKEMGDMKPPAGSPKLIKREMNALVAYLLASVVGRGDPTEEECVDFFGLDNNRCVNFANNGGAAGGAADDSGH